MFVGTQQRVTLGNHHYYVDMVFYNLILKCYVLIDLKSGTMKPEYAGKLNFYLSAVDKYIKDENDIWNNAGCIDIPDGPVLRESKLFDNIRFGNDEENFYLKFHILEK